ncbi:MAG: FGGY family carbohydrate kinase [Myxococcota bacterium]
MNSPLLLGVDLGTSALKCGVWDTRGRCHGRARIPYPTRVAGATADQDAGDIWRILGEGIRDAVAAEAAPRVAGLGVGGHAPSPVFVDGSLEPVARVPTWMDTRLQTDRAWIDRTLGRAPGSGAERLATHLASMGRWLMRTDPQRLVSARWAMHAGDYLASRLVGRPLATHASLDEIFVVAELSPSLRPELVLPAGTVAGGLCSGVAAALGLREGLPVIAGGLDAFLGVLGGGITEPGEASFNLGSSTIASLVVRPPTAGRFELGQAPVMSDVLPFGASTLRWLSARLGRSQPLLALVDDAFARPEALARPEADARLERERLGSHQDVVAMVERALVTDGLDHAAIVRRVVEGIERTHAQMLLERARSVGPVTRLTCIGGMARVAALHPRRAALCGVRVEVPREAAFGTALGGAMLAAVATGTLSSYREAAARMVLVASIYEPA